jgi:pimeloyl-ACP methyl ester carboxylesterase
MMKYPSSNSGSDGTENTKTRSLRTAPGMVFDVSAEGGGDAALVLMLHGFGVSLFFWNAQVHAVVEAGYFAVAPNQRGYAAGARPDLADHSQYRVARLIGDALDIVAAIGHGDRGFHLVGHDWGASLAWQIADQHPERLASLTILSRPHPLAFARALEMPDGEQRRRSRHHTTLLEADAGPNIRADNANWLRTRLIKNGVSPAAFEAHLSVIGNPAAMEAGRGAFVTRPSDQLQCQPCSSGAIRTTRLDGRQPRGQASSSQRHTSSPNCRASATMPSTKCRNRSTHYCWRTSHAVLDDHVWWARGMR